MIHLELYISQNFRNLAMVEVRLCPLKGVGFIQSHLRSNNQEDKQYTSVSGGWG